MSQTKRMSLSDVEDFTLLTAAVALAIALSLFAFYATDPAILSTDPFGLL